MDRSAWIKGRRASIALLLALAGCSDRPASISRSLDSLSRLQTVPAAADHDSLDLRGFIRALIDGRDAAVGTMTPAERTDLQGLYPPDRAPLWLDGDRRPGGNLRDALNVLSHSADDGLDPADYYQDILTPLMPCLDAASPASLDLARLDVAVSAALLRYLRHLHTGRIDPLTIGFRLEAAPDQDDIAALLRAAIAEHRVIDLVSDLRPPLEQYRLLRAMLPRYRSLSTDPTLIAPPPFTKAIHPGESYAATGTLYRQLLALGDLPSEAPAPPESGRYDAALVEGVKRFQIRHGLEPDGILGRSTVAALSVPLTWRVRQIEMALERLRWLPHLGAERLITLSIPMFRLWAWDAILPSGTPRFGMAVIVGRALRTQTPVFVAEMDEVIFRPYWNVPRSILRSEVLPAIERDLDYLRREDMEIVRGESDRAQHVDVTPNALVGLRQGVLRVRQRPGPKNALGLIKFVFPNREDVYMHGTPAQALFARSRRDFSHGCVRVADPVALAEWVLRDRPEWTAERIAAATMGTETIHVQLPHPIQVILFYATAGVMPEDGTIHFAEDIYRHDVRLDQALATRKAALSPHPHAPDVHMDEVRRGIVADAPATRLQRRAPQGRQRHVRETDIDGLSFHVQAAGSDALAAVPQHIVGRRRPIPGYHLKRLGCFGHRSHAMQQVEQIGSDVVDVTRPEIPQKVIHRRQRVRQVRATSEVLDGEPFTRVGVREVQGASACRGSKQGPRYGDDRDRRDYASEKRAAGMRVHGKPSLSAVS